MSNIFFPENDEEEEENVIEELTQGPDNQEYQQQQLTREFPLQLE